MAAAMLDRLEGMVDDEGRDLAPAVAVATGLLVTALVANAWLIWAGHAPLTALARTPAGRAFRSYFDRHCDRSLFLDWFSLGGHAVSRLPRPRTPLGGIP